MASTHPLRHLEEIDEEMESRSGYTGPARWMIPYADFLTILLGFFIILFAMVKMENQSLAQKAQHAKHALAAAQHQEVEYRQKIKTLSDALQKQDIDPVKLLNAAVAKAAAEVPQQSPAAMQNLEESLVKQLNLTGQQVTVRQDARGVVISFQDRIFFDPGKAALTGEAEKTLDKLSTVLVKTHHPIRVEGHTDNTPIQTAVFPSNWELSTSRATTIVRDLIEKHHFPPQSLSAAGYGEYYPLAENSTVEGKQKNRRVDIVLLNPLSGIPANGENLSSPRKTPTKE